MTDQILVYCIWAKLLKRLWGYTKAKPGDERTDWGVRLWVRYGLSYGLGKVKFFHFFAFCLFYIFFLAKIRPVVFRSDNLTQIKRHFNFILSYSRTSQEKLLLQEGLHKILFASLLTGKVSAFNISDFLFVRGFTPRNDIRMCSEFLNH